MWAGANSRDPITYLGNHGWVARRDRSFGAGLGDDPAEDDFGANRFQAEDVSRPGASRRFDQHSLYFDHDTESLHNIASIVNGDYDEVMHAEHNYDPWYAGVQDPELDRDPTTTDTLSSHEAESPPPPRRCSWSPAAVRKEARTCRRNQSPRSSSSAPTCAS